MTFEDNRGAARDLVEAWVRRPPMISAAIARTRVLARIAEKRRLRPFFLAASASAALGLLLALMVAVPKWSAEPVAEIATRAGAVSRLRMLRGKVLLRTHLPQNSATGAA